MVGGLYFLHPTPPTTEKKCLRACWICGLRVPLHLLRKQKLETRNDLYYSISKHRPEFRSTDQKQSKSKNMTNGDCSSDAIREGLLGPTSDEAVSSIFIQRASNSCCRVSLAAA